MASNTSHGIGIGKKNNHMNEKMTKWIIVLSVFILLIGGFYYLNNKKQAAEDTQNQNTIEQTNVDNIIKDEKNNTTIDSQATSSNKDTIAGQESVISDQQTQRLNSEYDQKMAELEAREDAGETIDWEKEMDKMAEGLDKQFSETETQLMSETIEE